LCKASRSWCQNKIDFHTERNILAAYQDRSGSVSVHAPASSEKVHSLIFFSVFSERVEHPYISDFQERNEECTFSDIAGAWTETDPDLS
jgi:hypothetical protein